MRDAFTVVDGILPRSTECVALTSALGRSFSDVGRGGTSYSTIACRWRSGSALDCTLAPLIGVSLLSRSSAADGLKELGVVLGRSASPLLFFVWLSTASSFATAARRASRIREREVTDCH